MYISYEVSKVMIKVMSFLLMLFYFVSFERIGYSNSEKKQVKIRDNKTKINENSSTNHDQKRRNVRLGNIIMLKGVMAYNSFDVDFIPLSRKDSYGYVVEHQTRLNRTSELVLSIEQMWFRQEDNYMAHTMWGYRFSWRYHIPYFILSNFYSMYLNVSWGIYDLWASGVNERLRTGSWSAGLGNRFFIGDNFAFQADVRIRNLQFFFPEREPSREIIDTIFVSLGFGYRYVSW